MNPKIFDLNLDGDAFEALKADFNAVLRKTISNMEQKGSYVAEITAKMKISLSSERVPDLSTVNYEATRDTIVPKFEHKVSSVIQIKDEVNGSLNGRYELIWDAERGEYVMREIFDGQISMYDDDDIPYHPDHEPAALPPGQEGGDDE
jgi:hypothetical protein